MPIHILTSFRFSIAAARPAGSISSIPPLNPHTHTQVTLHPHKGQATSADRDKEAHVRQLLEEAIVTERHPRTIIHVVLQALGDDGGLLACALNVRV